MKARPGDSFRLAMVRTTTDWQRRTMLAWLERNPRPATAIETRSMGVIEHVPQPCRCPRCRSAALRMPDPDGWVRCPRCEASVPERRVFDRAGR